MTPRMRQAGFSLVELAIVLVIIALVMGGGLVVLQANQAQQRHAEQQRQFRELRAALYGFAMSTGRLPCPDTRLPPDGHEDRTTDGDCVATAGTWPWARIGHGRRDAWGQPLHYAVDPGFAAEPPVGGAAFGFDDGGNITIRDAGGTTVASNAVAVIVSWGPDGDRVWTADGVVCTAARGLSADEQENCNGTRNFIAASYRDGAAPAGPFRHRLAWPSLLVLKSRMVDAGRLP